MTPTPDREEQVEKLPERSPLAGALEELVAAQDRDAVAAERDLEYRPDDGTVRVSVEFEPDGELPEGYRMEVLATYEGSVVAYVDVDELVPLALEDDVRKVDRPPRSRTGSKQS